MTSAMTSTHGRELVVGWFTGKRKGSEKGKEKTWSDRSLGKKALNDRQSGIGLRPVEALDGGHMQSS